MTPDPTWWFVAAGLVFVGMALAGSVLKRLPLSGSMFYLAAGFVLGPPVIGLFAPDPVAHAAALERVTEVVVLVSLFTAGLKLRVPLRDRRWLLPVGLATVSMALTVGLVAAAGVWGLGLSVGAAVLLGAVLAPTDPVLASDVQVADPSDRDRVRFALTGEAGLNDGTAFPFVMLGLGLLGLHDLGAGGWRWAVVDVGWATAAGLAVGTALGAAVGRLVVYLRRAHQEATGLDDFLALGLIGLAYGAALLLHGYGFLAVFAAGLALRRVGMPDGPDPLPDDLKAQARAGGPADAATDPATAPAYLAEAVLGFNERVERVAEVGVVVVLGGLLASVRVSPDVVWFVPFLLLVARPVSVLPVVWPAGVSAFQAALVGWFGVRGVGSLYYLMFALAHGLPEGVGREFADLVLVTVAVSIVVHGVSVTPLMELYARRRGALASRLPSNKSDEGTDHDPAGCDDVNATPGPPDDR